MKTLSNQNAGLEDGRKEGEAGGWEEGWWGKEKRKREQGKGMIRSRAG